MSNLRVNNITNEAGTGGPTFPSTTAFADPDNRIINGAFDVWQRGTSFTASTYGADRWININNGGTVTMSRQAFAMGDTLGSNAPRFFLRQTVSGQSGTNIAFTQQRMEGVETYADQTITVLGWVRRSSGAGDLRVGLTQFFGTGGSPSSPVIIGQQPVTLSASFEPFAATFTLPSVSGKVKGSDGNDFLEMNFITSDGGAALGIQTIGVDLWGIHIKRGTHTAAATDFYRAPELGPELARCQRYYQRYTEPALRGVASASSVVNRAGMQLPVVMRATPAATVGALPVFDGLNVSVVSSVSANHCTDRVAEFGFTVSPANLVTYRPIIVYQAGTATLSLDAEL